MSDKPDPNRNPSKIAKYLLKGYCLKNEYCPNGQNIPIVQGKDGRQICVGCDRSCPHFAKLGDSEDGAATFAHAAVTPAAAPVTPSPPSSLSAPPAAAAPNGNLGQPATSMMPAAGMPQLRCSMAQFPAAAPQAERPSSPCRTLSKPTTPSTQLPQAAFWPSSATSKTMTMPQQVAIQTPEVCLSCMYLASVEGARRVRLIGGSWAVRAQAGSVRPSGSIEGSFNNEALTEALRTECDRLQDCILIPEHGAHSSIANAGGGMLDICLGEGTQCTLPERECIRLPVLKVTLQAIAERLLAVINLANSQWIEVQLSEPAGSQVSLRKAIGDGYP